ncbi:hypothetical protein THRCLA_23278 [Thraustotheca clavata]|uniref:Uncharacterized protein n=1 Tax=Thraustotheca clavata TaxID=74557 RepID=A0A1V9Y8A2_9STRA|nr:hypothetical protein THRCLA_23278 [Thraustotheca clavata]
MNSSTTPYPESYQTLLNHDSQRVVSVVKVVFLGLSGAAFGVFLLILYGLFFKRPTWWYEFLVRWLGITNPETSTSVLFEHTNAVAVRRRASTNPLSMSLVEWRQHLEQNHPTPLNGKELVPPYYPVDRPATTLTAESTTTSEDPLHDRHSITSSFSHQPEVASNDRSHEATMHAV